jgi:uncharacterized protein YqgV (UPF0045/DUF77 family)
MLITLEISYYPLQNNYENLVEEFIQEISKNNNIQIITGVMSSLIIGEYEEVMKVLEKSMKEFLEKYPSVFKISLSNSCQKCEI